MCLFLVSYCVSYKRVAFMHVKCNSCKNLTQCLSIWFDCICPFINIIETCSFPQVFTGSSLIYCWHFLTLHVSITELGQFIHELGRSRVEEGKGRFSPCSTNWGAMGRWMAPGSGPWNRYYFNCCIQAPEEIYMDSSDKGSRKRGYLQDIFIVW